MHGIDHNDDLIRDQLIKKILNVLTYSSSWKEATTVEHELIEQTTYPYTKKTNYSEVKFVLELDAYRIIIIETNNYELGSSEPHPISYCIHVHPNKTEHHFFSTEVWVEEKEFDEFKEHMQAVKMAVKKREEAVKINRKKLLLDYLTKVNSPEFH